MHRLCRALRLRMANQTASKAGRLVFKLIFHSTAHLGAPWKRPVLGRVRVERSRIVISYRRFLLVLLSGMPTQVVVPSVSRAAKPHGTALTVLVETPSWATTFRPEPVVASGSGPLKTGVGALSDAGA
jgi:hypothetical protein